MVRVAPSTVTIPIFPTRWFDGVGLGWAISSQLVELMGGSLVVELTGQNTGLFRKIAMMFLDDARDRFHVIKRAVADSD